MYRIAICDDNPEYVDFLEEKIKSSKKYTDEMSISKYYSGTSFVESLDMTFNLVILDMQMENIDGLDAAFELRKHSEDTVIVFCTGEISPKPEHFNVNPFRYLLKSYSDDRLSQEIELALDKMISYQKDYFISIVSDGKFEKISIDGILYVSRTKRGTLFNIYDYKTKEKYEIKCNQKLPEIYEALKDYCFEYGHNSYIINFSSVIRVSKEIIELKDGTVLNLSRSKRDIFVNRFAKYAGKNFKRGMRWVLLFQV